MKKGKINRGRATMPCYLPQEMILNILSRLQVKTLLRFRCVCKSWCNLITSHDFVQIHLNHHALDHENNNCSLVLYSCADFYSIDSVSSSELCYEIVEFDPPFKSRLSYVSKILASCNGLLCIANVCGDGIFIWNPSTKEYKEISLPTTSKESRYIKALGFGYDCKIDDYKLVTIVDLKVNVYTLGSNSWRNVQSVPFKPFVPKKKSGVLLNGALHWKDSSSRSKVIFSFHIGHERFQEIELPNCLAVRIGYTSNVSVLRGDLCLLHHTNDESTEVWVMKDYGVVESWTKLFSIVRDPSVCYYKLIHCFKNVEFLFWGLVKKSVDKTDESDDDEELDAFVSYDPKHERVRTLKINGIPKWFDGVETYVGSLVSPNRVLL